MNLTIRKERRKARFYTEVLGDGVSIDMVQIPSGSFQMGSPETELERSESEGPQRLVTVSTFFMGKYPITQAQWRVVAAFPEVDRDLDPNPSRFKGENRPVEKVSWHEASEFCRRLTQHTDRPYRLPSEAEWEYACRAGTTTPFHFGETISTEVANYDGSKIYGQGVKGKYIQETTPVGSFNVANTFGLYDMHGNVWEWCEDHWHSNYEGAPTDGSAWIDETGSEQEGRVLRGGSWSAHPRPCRSANRYPYDAGRRTGYFGFRVVCLASRTL